MNATRLRFLAALVAALACAFGSSALLPVLSQRRVAEHLGYAAPAEELPPEMALGVVLGSFRGWFINYLWLRASRLQDGGQHHEALQLTHWITQLQPHFVRVWFFHAHNLAYNLSYAEHSPEDRWQRVVAAVALLRDEALDKNPFDAGLHGDLSRLFTARIEQGIDRTHWYNKLAFAKEWQRILGEPPAGGVEARAAWLAELAGARPGDGVAWARAQELRQIHRMDPALMLALTTHFEPLDWRHPASHGLYWAAQGVLRERHRRLEVTLPLAAEVAGMPDDAAEKVPILEDLSEIYASLALRGALRILMLSGRIEHRDADDTFLRRPEPAYMAPLELSREMLVLEPPGESNALREHYRDEIETCLETCWALGDEAAAERFLERLRSTFVTRRNGGPYPAAPAELPLMTALAWIESTEPSSDEAAQIRARIAGAHAAEEAVRARRDALRGEVAEAMIAHRIRMAYEEGLANGSATAFERWRALAEQIQRECGARGWLPAATADADSERVRTALRDLLLDEPAVADPLMKRRLWMAARDRPEFRAAADEAVVRKIAEQCLQAGIATEPWLHPPSAAEPPPR